MIVLAYLIGIVVFLIVVNIAPFILTPLSFLYIKFGIRHLINFGNSAFCNFAGLMIAHLIFKLFKFQLPLFLVIIVAIPTIFNDIKRLKDGHNDLPYLLGDITGIIVAYTLLIMNGIIQFTFF
ncbi:MAG: hypothetical protein KA807_11550 [Prolixibacteraceae bacterium]|nr:hypothetical protein [Prolixibacteraceae bacterium]